MDPATVKRSDWQRVPAATGSPVPSQRPIRLGSFTRSVGESMQLDGQCLTSLGRHRVEDDRYLSTTTGGYLGHDRASDFGETDVDRAAVHTRPQAAHEPLAHQTVDHATAGAGRHAERDGKIDGALRPASAEHYQRPVLRQRVVLVENGKAAGGHRNERPARSDEPVDQTPARRLRQNRHDGRGW